MRHDICIDGVFGEDRSDVLHPVRAVQSRELTGDGVVAVVAEGGEGGGGGVLEGGGDGVQVPGGVALRRTISRSFAHLLLFTGFLCF